MNNALEGISRFLTSLLGTSVMKGSQTPYTEGGVVNNLKGFGSRISDYIGQLGGDLSNNYSAPSSAPTPSRVPTPMPTPTPTPQSSQMVLDYSPYVADQNKVNSFYPQGLPQPPSDVLSRILSISPDDATRSAILKLVETGGFNPYPPDYTGNANGTIDRGPNMINSGTFDWLQNQQGNMAGTYPYREKLESGQIESFDDMRDPYKNEFVMNLIRELLGYGAWFGPQDRGFNLNQ